jgi:hypothetical protein
VKFGSELCYEVGREKAMIISVYGVVVSNCRLGVVVIHTRTWYPGLFRVYLEVEPSPTHEAVSLGLASFVARTIAVTAEIPDVFVNKVLGTSPTPLYECDPALVLLRVLGS